MQTMRPATRTVLFQLQTPGLVAAVFAGDVVTFLAFGTGKDNMNTIGAFFGHGLEDSV
jgi:hypothetical protein